MDKKAMHKLSYGLYVVTTRNAEKANGCIVNTAIQAASTPNQICVCINKANYTHDMLLNTGVFNVSVLSRTAEFPLYERFGFQSGREVDKFADIFYQNENQSAGDLGKLQGQLRPAIDRYEVLEVEKQDIFKSTLASFNRVYAYITQVCRLFDKDIHRFSIYSKFLYLSLIHI